MSSFDLAVGAGISPARGVRRIMAIVLLALVPGVAVSAICVGYGVLIQVWLALAFAVVFEAALLKWRAQPIALFLSDLSAPLTAVLFALLVPPSAPWWVPAVGMAVAIVFAKQAFGGLGSNLFNPAMAGLAAVALAFPREFEPVTTASSGAALVGNLSGHGDAWLALAYTLGGLVLLRKKIIPWQTPAATLAAALLSGASLVFLDTKDNSLVAQPMLPAIWLLGAFFIVTDPVTGCLSKRGRLLFGAGVGTLGMWIGYGRGDPSGLAFAVLLMNCAAPWIDRQPWVQPRRPASAQKDASA